ncbi:MAG: hypothetical protein ACFFCW_00565 [Candidatus Hodarchaeota archaeon]
MSILRDEDIYNEIQDEKLISSGLPKEEVKFEDIDSSIQPSSLDLHVGKIYIPDQNFEYSNKIPIPGEEHVLQPGETVTVTTREELRLPDDVAGIGFPPSKVSEKGILTTNPGHIDPGYRGYIHLTIINMGKKAYTLRTGDPVVTLLFFRLTRPVKVDYQARREKAGKTCDSAEEETHIIEILSRLAPHFMNYEIRAKDVAKKEIERERKKINSRIFWVTLAGAFVPLFILAFGLYLNWRIFDACARLKILEGYVSIMESGDTLKKSLLLDTVQTERRIQHLEEQMDRIAGQLNIREHDSNFDDNNSQDHTKEIKQ